MLALLCSNFILTRAGLLKLMQCLYDACQPILFLGLGSTGFDYPMSTRGMLVYPYFVRVFISSRTQEDTIVRYNTAFSSCAGRCFELAQRKHVRWKRSDDADLGFFSIRTIVTIVFPIVTPWGPSEAQTKLISASNPLQRRPCRGDARSNKVQYRQQSERHECVRLFYWGLAELDLQKTRTPMEGKGEGR